MHINKDIVKYHMELKNIQTFCELAERLDISPSQLSQMLSEDYLPIKPRVYDLLDVLEVPLSSLISDSAVEFNDSAQVMNRQVSMFDDGIKNRFEYRLDSFTDVSSEKAKKPFTVIETFAGAGGLALGLESAGFNSVGAIELNKDAAATLRKNRPHWNVIEGDINQIVSDGISKVIDLHSNLDLLSGGFPCQSFSYAGKRRGFEDTRGTLFYPYYLLLDQLQPKVFLAENVKGLVNHDHGRTLSTMIEVFDSAGYTLFWNVLNAWDYDVAQKRERIFIVGIRNDLVEAQQYEFKFPQAQQYKPVLRDVINDVPNSEGVSYSDKKRKVLELVPPGGCWVDLPVDIAKDYLGASWKSGGGKRGMARRLSWDEPSLTLTTSPNQKQTERCHPEYTRPFTVREYARIQAFPDDWLFEGSVYEQYKQIGNAVPTTLASYVGLSLIKYLNQFV